MASIILWKKLTLMQYEFVSYLTVKRSHSYLNDNTHDSLLPAGESSHFLVPIIGSVFADNGLQS